MTSTANKNYNNQATGSNVNTWGVINNSNFSIIDLNLGGRLDISISGSTTVTANQAQNLMHIITGTLAANASYIFPALGGVYLVENDTAGGFNLAITVTGGAASSLLPAGAKALVFVNPDDLTVKVEIIASYQSSLNPSIGSANAQSISAAVPGPFVLYNGAMISWVAGSSNTSGMTLAVGGTTATNCTKLTQSGLVALVQGDVIANSRYISIYDSASNSYVMINTSQNLGTLATLGIGAGLVNDGSGNLTIATSANLPGSPTTTTQSAADSSTKIATTGFVNGTALTLQNGTTASTQSAGTNDTHVANCQFAMNMTGAAFINSTTNTQLANTIDTTLANTAYVWQSFLMSPGALGALCGVNNGSGGAYVIGNTYAAAAVGQSSGSWRCIYAVVQSGVTINWYFQRTS